MNYDTDNMIRANTGVQTYSKFREIVLPAIRPEGWLRVYLEKQRRGLTGYLEASGYPFNTRGWRSWHVKVKHGEKWWPYEQTAFWIDGMVRCGYLLQDEFLIGKAKQHMDYVLDHPDAEGYLGPPTLKKSAGLNRWPHAVFFRALMAYFSSTMDNRVLLALSKHFLSGTATHSDGLDLVNIESMLWTYEKTGDTRLLNAALHAYATFNNDASRRTDAKVNVMLSDKKLTNHNFVIEMIQLAAILYTYTGKKKLLQASINAFRKIDRDQMLIDGVPSSSEVLRDKDPLESHEICQIAAYTWACGYMLIATGDVEYADKIERACFNAAPGAVRSDFKALQYFSCPNQVIADGTSNHNIYYRGDARMSFRPNPGEAECCPGNVNRIMPNYVARMWLKDNQNGLVAALYGPSHITAKVGTQHERITIVEETSYPFSERIDFSVRVNKPISFYLSFRIPGWCNDPRLIINNQDYKGRINPGSFLTINRNFKNNDRLTLLLPMDVKTSRWSRGGVGIERGPLVYCLRIKENWHIDNADRRSTREFPAWNLYASSPWNYALNLDTIKQKTEVHHKQYTPDPWCPEAAPIEIRLPARKIKAWRLERKNSIKRERNFQNPVVETIRGRFIFTPQLPKPETVNKGLCDRVEMVTLVPYGCTHLRISLFPVYYE